MPVRGPRRHGARSVGPTWLILLGTGVIGLAITLGNIVVPVIIRREVPWNQVGMVTGLYSAMMNVGSMVTLIGTGPLAALVGWRWAIGLWAVLALLGLGYWMILIRTRIRRTPIDGAAGDTAGAEAGAPAVSRTAEAKRPWREVSPEFRRIVVLLVITFSGQSIAYYTTTTWSPSILADTARLDPALAGGTASLFQVSAIVGAFGVPLLAARSRPWVPVAIVAALWLSLPLGMLTAPDAYVVWAVTGGIAQGGGFTAILSIIARTAGGRQGDGIRLGAGAGRRLPRRDPGPAVRGLARHGHPRLGRPAAPRAGSDAVLHRRRSPRGPDRRADGSAPARLSAVRAEHRGRAHPALVTVTRLT